MILYDFQCINCAHKFEAFLQDDSKPLTECQNCGKLSATKTLSYSGLVQGCPTPKYHGRK